MKKLVLSLAVISALGLSGCDSETIEDVKKDVAENGTPVIASARVVFDPGADVPLLSVPNDLLFSGTTDGTLNLPVDDATDFSDPTVAMSAVDGWSTTNPFVLDIDFPTDRSLDGNTVFSPASVKIFECEPKTLADDCVVTSELTFGEDFVAQASGNSIAVVPLKPLKGKTTYILALTNNLKDNTGKSIAGSSTYESVRQDITTHPLATEAQLGLQSVINSYENAIVTAGADKDSLIYTMSLTTQSTVDVLATTKALMANNVPAMVEAAMGGTPTIGIQDTGMSVADILAGQIPAELVPLYSSANFFQGSISLPYYSGIPTAENPMAPVNDWWKGLCDSGLTLSVYAASGGTIPEGALSVADATCIAVADAAGLAAPGLRDLSTAPGFEEFDTERNLTQYSPIPKQNTAMDVVVQMTTPDVAIANMVRPSFGLAGDLVEPAAGWPVIILQHGITSKKEDMLAITGILSAFGFATVAINQPMHGDPDVFGGLLPGGSRGFDLNGDGTDEINASTVSATHYMNLASLLTTRDNLRQSTSDLLGLRLGLNFLGGVDLDGNPIKVDASQVHFLGHSLGAIVGINFIGLTNTALDPQVDPLFAVNTNSLAMPGLMAANFLFESGAFGNVVKSSLTYAASEEFQGYVAQVHPGEVPPTEAELVGYYLDFYALLTPEQQAGLESTFAEFAFAAQTVTDAGDPANYAAMMAATNTPTHLIEVVGDGGANLSDQVIPNSTSAAPFGGTEGAITLLGLPSVSADAAGSGAVRFVYGHHSSILDPSAKPEAPDNTAASTQEMQGQVAGFFLSNGQAITVTNPEVVQ